MHVCLFDIDGTLLNTGGAGQAAMEQAFANEFSAEHSGAHVSVAGRTDAAIVRDFFGCFGVECTPPNLESFQREYLRLLPAELESRQGLVLPGVPELLAAMHSREDILLGLLTGNFEEAAQIKLQFYGIAQYFDFGGFGDLHPDRSDVARLALGLAHPRHPNGQFEPEKIWVIGDTVGDVDAGRAINAKVIAVGTGFCDRDLLHAANPDFFFEDFQDSQSVLDLFD